MQSPLKLSDMSDLARHITKQIKLLFTSLYMCMKDIDPYHVLLAIAIPALRITAFV